MGHHQAKHSETAKKNKLFSLRDIFSQKPRKKTVQEPRNPHNLVEKKTLMHRLLNNQEESYDAALDAAAGVCEGGWGFLSALRWDTVQGLLALLQSKLTQGLVCLEGVTAWQ